MCTHDISIMPYQGFSTAICYYCANGIPRPPEADAIDEPGIYTQEELKKDKTGGLFLSVIRALGFKQKEHIQVSAEEKKKLPSVKESKRKARKPLFPSMDFREKKEEDK